MGLCLVCLVGSIVNTLIMSLKCTSDKKNYVKLSAARRVLCRVSRDSGDDPCAWPRDRVRLDSSGSFGVPAGGHCQ